MTNSADRARLSSLFVALGQIQFPSPTPDRHSARANFIQRTWYGSALKPYPAFLPKRPRVATENQAGPESTTMGRLGTVRDSLAKAPTAGLARKTSYRSFR